MTLDAEHRYWIEAGTLVPSPAVLDDNPATVEERLHRLGHVRIVSGSLGTEIKWSTFAPCHASLFAAMEFLRNSREPVVLRYYLSGWFEELGLTTGEASHRIEQIMQRSDRHLNKKAYVFQREIVDATPPPLIQRCWQLGAPIKEYSVDCVYLEETGQYFVERIGPGSALAKYFGTNTASFACQPSNSYGETVSEIYDAVVASARPSYDQVLASLPLAPMTFHWLPYHRLVFPTGEAPGQRRVSVITEVAPIDFQLI